MRLVERREITIAGKADERAKALHPGVVILPG
jgi:hypothetical protein